MVEKRVAVTGGSGFVGTNLVSFFVDQGWEVLNLDIAAPRNREQLSFWRDVDLLDRARLIRETRAFMPLVFLHFGARTDLNEQRTLGGYAANIEGVRNVIQAIRSAPSVERAIFASSQLVCRLGYAPRDEYDYQPYTLYGQSKALSERIIRTAEDMGAVWTIVRPTSLWGPWFDVPYKSFFLAIAKNLYVHPGGKTTLKQWGYIGNVVFQIWKLIQARAELVHKKVFYLADYQSMDLHDFADKVQIALGARPIRTIPAKILRAAAIIGDMAKKLGWKNPPLTSFRYINLVTSEVHDLEPLRKIVGPLPYTVEQGINCTVEWLQGQSVGAAARM
jgi:nucleoside-diphosphate-sugar epimerase